MSRAIASVDGVTDVQVSFADKKAEVTSQRCGDDVASEISQSLEKAGYGGEVVDTTPSS